MPTDFLIVGGGIAGLRAAIGLAGAGRVAVLTKTDPGESNTGLAQGGIAAAVGDDDSVELHASDTLHAGDGLCDERAVAVLVGEGPRYVQELVAWGTRFDCDGNGKLVLGREAAHSVRRVLHAGDATGREIGRVLWERVRALPSVGTLAHAFVTELLVEGGRAVGVVYFDREGRRAEVRAQATLLATGGAGQVFRETTNPSVATGDGISLAYRAGARVADLEFVQFHPTALSLAGAPRFLMSEALRGEGARLVNARGETFMERYHAGGDLAPRDVVARSIVHEEERTGGRVFLTLAHLDPAYVSSRFPMIADMCRRIGLDIARDPIPVGPAAHYIMGGIDTDEWSRTSLPGLFAAGEVACTGVHGANRLASNSLLEGLVFGARAAEAMQQPPAAAALGAGRKVASGLQPPAATSFTARGVPPPLARARRLRASRGPQAPPQPLDTDSVRDLMWRFAGVFRTGEGLERAVSLLDAATLANGLQGRVPISSDPDAWRHFHLVTVARLMARAALRREESRGGHFRADFPARDDLHWKAHFVDQIDTHGQER